MDSTAKAVVERVFTELYDTLRPQSEKIGPEQSLVRLWSQICMVRFRIRTTSLRLLCLLDELLMLSESMLSSKLGCPGSYTCRVMAFSLPSACVYVWCAWLWSQHKLWHFKSILRTPTQCSRRVRLFLNVLHIRYPCVFLLGQWHHVSFLQILPAGSTFRSSIWFSLICSKGMPTLFSKQRGVWVGVFVSRENGGRGGVCVGVCVCVVCGGRGGGDVWRKACTYIIIGTCCLCPRNFSSTNSNLWYENVFRLFDLFTKTAISIISGHNSAQE